MELGQVWFGEQSQQVSPAVIWMLALAANVPQLVYATDI